MSILQQFNVFKNFKIEISPFYIERSKVLWLTRLRWVVCLFFFVLAVPFYFNQFLNRSQLMVYIGLISVLTVVNIFIPLLYVDSKKDVPAIAVFYQLILDLMMATSLLFVAGSFTNPFCTIIFLNTFVAGFLLNPIFSRAFLVIAHSCIGVLQIFSLYSQRSNLDDRTLLLMISFHFVNLSCWFVARLIGDFFKKFTDLQIQQANSIEKLNRLKAIGALAAGFSHEFASPLNAAKLSLDRALRNSVNEKLKNDIKNDLSLAIDSLQVCEEIIGQMNTSQMDIRSFSFKKVRLKELLTDIIESWTEENGQASIKVHYDGDGWVVVPVINFAQVVINLLDNAYQADSKSDILVTLNINDKYVELIVIDKGPGFSSDILDRVGEPFMTTKANGSGLGLYVASLFVESLGGKLVLSNNLVGAQVKLVWPNNVSIL